MSIFLLGKSIAKTRFQLFHKISWGTSFDPALFGQLANFDLSSGKNDNVRGSIIIRSQNIYTTGTPTHTELRILKGAKTCWKSVCINYQRKVAKVNRVLME